MAPHRHGSMDTPGGSPWQTLRRDEGGAVFRKLVITLDGLLVSLLVVIAFAVTGNEHWRAGCNQIPPCRWIIEAEPGAAGQ
jgi:hypothetical protein